MTVRLPSELRGKSRWIKSYGGAHMRADTGPDTIGFDSSGPISRETGLEFYVAFQHGILKIKKPDWQPHNYFLQFLHWLVWGWVLAIGFTSPLFLYFRRKCPACGRAWGLRRINVWYWFFHDFGRYEYRCRNCGHIKWGYRRMH